MPLIRNVILPLAVLLAGLALLVPGGEARADSPPPYYPFGPQIDVPVATLGEGWNLCYSSNYNDPVADLDDVLAACDGEYLLLAGKPVGSDTFDVLAAAPRADAIVDTGNNNNVVHAANGSGWYFNANQSWGFAPAGSPVFKNDCDINDSSDFPGVGGVADGEHRLCWVTLNGDLIDGWRSGFTSGLQDGVTTHERFIYQSAPAGDITPPTAKVKFERKQGDGWVKYTPGQWSRTIVRAVLTCDDAGSGMMDLEKKQQKIFKQSMDETIEIASLFRPCEDRAGNVNDLSALGSAAIMVDLQDPTCAEDPSYVRVTANGEFQEFDFFGTLSDDMDDNVDISLRSLVSSDGGGASALAFVHKDSDTIAHAGIEVLRTKAGLQRTYTAVFEIADDAGRTCECIFKVKVK